MMEVRERRLEIAAAAAAINVLRVPPLLTPTPTRWTCGLLVVSSCPADGLLTADEVRKLADRNRNKFHAQN